MKLGKHSLWITGGPAALASVVTFYFTSIKVRLSPLTMFEAFAIGTGVSSVVLFLTINEQEHRGEGRGWRAGELFWVLFFGSVINGWMSLVAVVGLALFGMHAWWE